MRTLLLDRDRWDLVKDAAGNIAVASSPYAVTQDVASAIRLFTGELTFDTSKGVPYWEEILGRPVPLAHIRSRIASAAQTVPEVVSSRVFFSTLTDRNLSGQVQLVLDDGSTAVTTFGV